MKKISAAALCLLFACGHGFAQASFEKLKEIKLSGRYHYGEATGMDTVQLLQAARQQLTGKISRLYLEQPDAGSSRDSLLLIGAIDQLVMPYGRKYKVLAYIDTQQVNMKRQSAPQEINIIPVVHTAAAAEHTARVTGGPVIEQMKQYTRAGELRQFLYRQQRSGRLSYVGRESLVRQPAACYIVVLDLAQNKVLALLGAGSKERLDLATHQPIPDFKTKYPKADFIWVYVY